jgi:hypothetical protein
VCRVSRRAATYGTRSGCVQRTHEEGGARKKGKGALHAHPERARQARRGMQAQYSSGERQDCRAHPPPWAFRYLTACEANGAAAGRRVGRGRGTETQEPVVNLGMQSGHAGKGLCGRRHVDSRSCTGLGAIARTQHRLRLGLPSQRCVTKSSSRGTGTVHTSLARGSCWQGQTTQTSRKRERGWSKGRGGVELRGKADPKETDAGE